MFGGGEAVFAFGMKFHTASDTWKMKIAHIVGKQCTRKGGQKLRDFEFWPSD